MSREKFVELILARLERDKEKFSRDFSSDHDPVKTRYFCVDGLLPPEMAHSIYQAFPKEEGKWRRMKSFREDKLTSKDLEGRPPILSEITFAIQDPRVVKLVEKITGIQGQGPDSSLYAGGLSLMKKGNFLNPHVDNSHDFRRQRYRTLNLLYYVSPDWALENGGNLELWDLRVKNKVTILSAFNRLVVMETNKTSWHSVNQVTVERPRCCVSNYYFSPQSPYNHEYFHITAFMARPEQRLLRSYCHVDTFLRTAVRKVVKLGLGRVDLYQR